MNVSGGTTLHSGLDFKFGTEYQNMNRKKLDKLKDVLQDLELIVIDEMSMVSSDMLYKLNDRLRQIFYPCEEVFGGKSIMLVGDLLQLKPVRGRFIFETPKSTKYVPYHEAEPLWYQFEVVVLETNHRQGVSAWASLLSRARIEKMILSDYKDLESRRFLKFPKTNPTKDMHVCYTNKEAHAINSKNLDSIPAPLVEMKSETKYPRGYEPKITEHGTIDGTQFKELLQLKVGARVMLVFNVNTVDSLVNGALGVVTKFVKEKNEVTSVVVEFDNIEAGLEQKRHHQDFILKHNLKSGVPLFRVDFEYALPFKKGSKSHNAKGKIKQYALKLASACTAHKLQGANVQKESKLFIHGHNRLPRGMGYVMLSRCTDINSVYLDENFDLKKILAVPEALEENERLNKRSIVPKFKNEQFDLYMINVDGKCKDWLLDVEADPYAERSKIVAVVETWIDPNEESKIKSKLGTFYGASYGNGKGCGVFTNEKVTKVKRVVKENFQLVSLILPNNVQVIAVYSSSTSAISEHVEKLKDAINEVLISKTCYITGDFNFETNEKGVSSLMDFFMEKGLEQVIQLPTHEKGRTIDHLYVPKGSKEKIDYKLSYPIYSDHAAIRLKFQK